MKYANNIWQAGSKPLHVGLLLLDESNMLSLAAAVDPMRACNRRADRELFSWQFLSQTGEPVHLTSGMTVQTEEAARVCRGSADPRRRFSPRGPVHPAPDFSPKAPGRGRLPAVGRRWGKLDHGPGGALGWPPRDLPLGGC